MTKAKQLGFALIGSPSENAHDVSSSRDVVVRHFADPGDALGDPSTDAVALCFSVKNRSYWLQEAAARGKHALCAPPLSSSYHRLRNLQRQFAAARRNLDCLVSGGVLALSSWLTAPTTHSRTGPLLYCHLTVAISRLEMDNEGILLRHAVPYLSLFRRFGSIDSIFARARSMGANRPTEDIAFGSFRFTNGLETTVEFNGLGVSKNVRMELYGRRGQMSCHLEHFDESRSLQDQISSFASISQKDYANTSEAKGVSHGHHLAGWMLQSARFERELNKREVKLD